MAEGIIKRGIRVANIVHTARKLRQLDDDKQQTLARHALVNQFTDARGVLMKVGQLLASTASDDSFDQLVKGIPAIPLEEMKSYIELALRQPLSAVFKSISESENAASLGQVHQALLLNGREVAIKIQYPDIADKVLAEIKILGLMPGMGPVKKWGFDLALYKKTFKNNMDRELNYQHEAITQQLFKQQVTVPGLCVPTVYPEYSNAKILVQSWEDGAYIDDINHWSAADRKKAGEILLATLFKSLFEVGMVHGDPHKGNCYFRYNAEQNPEVVLMDYGCTIILNEIQRLSLLKLIIADSENLDISPLRYFAAIGFDVDKLAKIGNELPILCKLLFKPFSEPGTFFVSNWMLESNFKKLLEERRWWFRSAGPSELFLLMRAFQGIVQQLQMLRTNVSWSQVLYQTISPDVIEKARALTLTKLPQENNLLTAHTSSIAKSLRVKVCKNGRQTVDIILPAEMVLDLESLMPEDVLTQIKKSSRFNLDSIQLKIRESGIAPQSVFDFESGEKQYQVWLE